MESFDRRLMLGAAGLAGVAAISKLAQAGPLDPPSGPVAPTGRTLQSVYDKIARTDQGSAEPRTPIQSLAGSGSSLHVITSPGSYYLADNLQGASGKIGIEVAADHVSIDLRGFELRGGPGSLEGIKAQAGTTGLKLRNGIIAAWGGSGIIGTYLGRFEGLTVRGCGGRGALDAGVNAMVLNCHVRDNASIDAGITSGEDSLLHSCVATGNAAGMGSVGNANIIACLANGNGKGIHCSFFSQLLDCVCMYNAQEGIWGEYVCHVERCYVKSNNVGIGGSGGRFINNYSHSNAIGIAGNDLHVEGNVVDSCGTGISVTGRSLVVSNRVRNCTPTFSLDSSVAFGPIVNVSAGGPITAFTGANHPYANFTY